MAWAEQCALARAAVLGTFGEVLTYTPKGGTPRSTSVDGGPILGVFRSSTEEPSMETGTLLLVERPNVAIDLAQFAPETPKRGDVIAIATRSFTGIVQEVRLDGEGGATVMMQRSA